MNVDEKDIRKHKNGIAKLAVILDGNDSILLLEEVRGDLDVFLNQYEREPADLKNMRIKDIANAEIIRRLRDVSRL